MDRLGIAYEVASPRCDETLAPGTLPRDGTLELARRKARSVADDHPGSLIIGSDQMAHVDGEVLHKPGTRPAAVDQLMRLSGRTHELWTAVALLDPGSGLLHEHVQVCRLTMRELTRDMAEAYVRSDAPLDCAGSYRFESRGVVLFEHVECEDPTAITGLPLMALVRMLARCAVVLP